MLDNINDRTNRAVLRIFKVQNLIIIRFLLAISLISKIRRLKQRLYKMTNNAMVKKRNTSFLAKIAIV